MSCGTTIRVLFSRALSHPKHSRPWLCRGRGCRGGRLERTHTANSRRVGRQVVRGWTFGRRAAREADEMAALDAVGDYEADPNVMLEDVPQDIVIKTLKVSCACVPVLVFACVCASARMRETSMCS